MTDKTKTDKESPNLSLGELLISYRKSADLDIEQTAEALRLAPSILSALENEQFNLLPEPPYVRGYLRGYAKLVEKDPKELLIKYDEIRGIKPEDTLYHFTPASKLEHIIDPVISPTAVRFILFAIILLALSVASMIPSVKEWANDTWKSVLEVDTSKVKEDDFANEEIPSLNMVGTIKRNTTEDGNKSEQETNSTSATDIANATDKNKKDNTNTEKTITAKNKPEQETNSTSATEIASVTDKNKKDNTNTEKTITAKSEPEKETNSTSTTDIANATDKNKKDNTNTEKTVTEKTEPEKETNSTSATDIANLTDKNKKDNTNTEKTVTEKNKPEKETNSTPATEIANLTDKNKKDDTNTEETLTEKNKLEKEPSSEDSFPVDFSKINTDVGEVAIKLIFEDEVWMQVKNSSGKKVFRGLKAKGKSEEFKAVKPLKFKIGNAPGVRVYINGQRFDTTEYTRGSVARFKVE